MSEALNLKWLRMRWLFNRRTGRALAWTLILLTLAVAANVAGIALVGSVARWQHWMAQASSYFLIWRLCLYGATVYGWLWMRRRLLAREPGDEARRRLIRVEIAGALAITALEVSLFVQAP
jgi:hypothetical protein